MYMGKHDQKTSEQGIVAIVVTIILMIILTLIVLSFAQISRREQRNALDRQLSTQAFYAAESGVNDARIVLENWAQTNDPKLNSDYMSTCNGFAAIAGASVRLGTALPGAGAASYTCLFVDPSTTNIVVDATDSQQILPIRYTSGAPIVNLDIYWDDGTTSSTFTGCPAPTANPATTSNCNAPVLRVELVDADPATAENLSTNKVFFIYPHATAGGTISYGSATGTTAQGRCNSGGPRKCLISLTNLNANYYLMRLKGIYKPMALTINPAAGAEFSGAQALIDVTGKASDVERRIQVRVPITTFSTAVPLFGAEANDKVCKQFYIDGTNVNGGPCFPANAPN